MGLFDNDVYWVFIPLIPPWDHKHTLLNFELPVLLLILFFTKLLIKLYKDLYAFDANYSWSRWQFSFNQEKALDLTCVKAL